MRNNAPEFLITIFLFLVALSTACDNPFSEEEKSPPVLSVSAISLEFGDSLNNLTFTITDSGEDKLEWTISSVEEWIDISPDSGTTEDEVDIINVTVDRANLDPDEYIGIISVTSNGGEQSIIASLTRNPAPILATSILSIDFSTDNITDQFVIRNTGIGALNWKATDDKDWIALSPAEGSTLSESDTVTVSVSRTNLAVGNHLGLLAIESNGGDVGILVNISVEAVPNLSVTPIIIDFGSNQSLSQLSIQNIGGGSLNWRVSENLTWISVSPDSGTVTSETDVLNVSADREVLEPGEYSGFLSVITNGGVQDVSVSLSKESEPILEVWPLILDFGSSDSLLTFSIWNIGEGLLAWSVTDTNTMGWLTMSPVEGSVFTGTDTVKVAISRFNLTPRDYTGQILIRSDGGNTEILVEMVVP